MTEWVHAVNAFCNQRNKLAVKNLLKSMKAQLTDDQYASICLCAMNVSNNIPILQMLIQFNNKPFYDPRIFSRQHSDCEHNLRYIINLPGQNYDSILQQFLDSYPMYGKNAMKIIIFYSNGLKHINYYKIKCILGHIFWKFDEVFANYLLENINNKGLKYACGELLIDRSFGKLSVSNLRKNINADKNNKMTDFSPIFKSAAELGNIDLVEYLLTEFGNCILYNRNVLDYICATVFSNGHANILTLLIYNLPEVDFEFVPKLNFYKRILFIAFLGVIMEIAFALTELPMPLQIAVVDEACYIAPYIPYHIKWNIIFAIKHSPGRTILLHGHES